MSVSQITEAINKGKVEELIAKYSKSNGENKVVEMESKQKKKRKYDQMNDDKGNSNFVKYPNNKKKQRNKEKKLPHFDKQTRDEKIASIQKGNYVSTIPRFTTNCFI